MDKFIYNELLGIETPIQWDKNSTYIHVPKKGSNVNIAVPKPDGEIKIGSVYSIKIENYILNPPEGFSLAANWNGGTNPPEAFMTGIVLQNIGKMYRFDLKATFNEEVCWEGWLPRKGFTIV